MKTYYRGYEISVTRERCMGGWDLLYYSIFRQTDGYECLSNFEDSAETVRGMVKRMKARIDEELKQSDPWGERERDSEFG